MNEHLPTFSLAVRNLAGTLRGFSYKDSLFTRGAAWTLICLAVCLLFILLNGCPGEGPCAMNKKVYALLGVLAVFPGSQLAGFGLGAALSGGAAGWRDALRRGVKSSLFLFLVLQAMAVFSLFSRDVKGPLGAVLLFWAAVLVLLAGMAGGFARWLRDRSRPA